MSLRHTCRIVLAVALALLGGGLGTIAQAAADWLPANVGPAARQELWPRYGWTTFQALYNPLWAAGLVLLLVALGPVLRPGGPRSTREIVQTIRPSRRDRWPGIISQLDYATIASELLGSGVSLTHLVAFALVAIKLLPAVPGHFSRAEYIALAGWIATGLVLRNRSRAIF